MKRAILTALLAALLLTGCAAQAGPSNAELGWDEDWVRVGELLGVEPAEPFTLSENKDAMGVYGLYYATWVAGEAAEYTNADGEEARLYDAQIYLLLQHGETEEEARSALEEWERLERENYQSGEATTETCAGQQFRLLPLLQGKEGNPYSHGAVALAARGSWAISVELLCQDSFSGDAQTCLTEFLSGLHYVDEEAD